MSEEYERSTRPIAFYHEGPVHPYVHKMVASVKEHYSHLIQMTDQVTEQIEGTDELIRGDYGHMAYSRICHIRDYPHEELLILDNDLLVKRQVDEVWDWDFDVALGIRPGLDDRNKYNSGVMFSRSHKFWVDCAEWFETQGKKTWDWGGEQRSVNFVANNKKFKHKYKVCNLNCGVYNWAPPKNKNAKNDKAAIWHYKGGDRKKWM